MNKKLFDIRPIEIEDGKFIYTWKKDPTIFKYLGGGYNPQSLFEVNEFMPQLSKQSSKNKRFMIVNCQNEEPIGLVGLYNINVVHRTCDIGIYIGNRKFQGKGAATIAVKLIEQFAKNYLNLRKITLSVVAENQSAVKFWDKQKYSYVGTMKEERYIDGKYCDLEIREKFL
ncbi:GNAT family N-acetyltransferase [Enterococcus sp. 2201sp1_2201st1_B8_2201SCRN_220225]|uniref:GNAT family N-acetyltransferase n=1 Tax=unclassified Enterococcus TaxID=2608891 RepID=UPI0034A35F38